MKNQDIIDFEPKPYKTIFIRKDVIALGSFLIILALATFSDQKEGLLPSIILLIVYFLVFYLIDQYLKREWKFYHGILSICKALLKING